MSHSLTDKDTEKELVEQNRKILDKVQDFLSENNQLLLNAKRQAVTQSTMSDEENYFWEYYTEMLKVLNAGTVATLKVKKPLSHISGANQHGSVYAKVSTMIAHLPELQ